MEISKLFGLPAHPLVIHLVVLSIPLMAIGVLLHVAIPSRRHGGRLPLAGLTILTLLATLVAAGSGEKLESMVEQVDGEISPGLHQHTELGDQTRFIVIVWVIVTLLYLFLDWRAYRSRNGSGTIATPSGLAKGVMTLGIVAIVLGGVASVWDIRAGHTGAKAVWGEEFANVTPAAEEGEGDDD